MRQENMFCVKIARIDLSNRKMQFFIIWEN